MCVAHRVSETAMNNFRYTIQQTILRFCNFNLEKYFGKHIFGRNKNHTHIRKVESPLQTKIFQVKGKEEHMDINKIECNGRLLSYRVKNNIYILTVLVIRGKFRNKYDIHFKGDVMKGRELVTGKGINVKGYVVSHVARDENKKLIDITFLAGTELTQESTFASAFSDAKTGVSKDNYFKGAVSGEIVSKKESNGYTNIFVRTGGSGRNQTIRLSYKGSLNAELHDRIRATYNAVMKVVSNKDHNSIAFDGYITEWEKEYLSAAPNTDL